ncbi:arginyltransferase [Methylomonas sp. SURF-2]|uniref:Aspartate/glutamate leucyltransferase n=1 Tax=Methylomonas subterranea TaxID=2952225 RepID=A0ABT1TJU1_9GAMM|nr:arginyltransferase [Methylomonas sp. SURF-2]MCQ8105746.1 arginyltransferase [Methylomonas sp. SURF-2]
MISIPLWLSAEHDCSYLEGKLARSAVVQPDFPLDTAFYSRLIEQGFRRSGDQVYRPHCQHCKACVPTRVPVAAFRANRGQRRCARRNQHTQVIIKTAEFNERHFDLYRRYQRARHQNPPDAAISREDYLHFLTSHWCETWFVEFLIEGRLAAVAVVDALDHALSAVYTFFDPDFDAYSPGVFAVLWQIEEAKRRELEFVYLGFWIADCRKMRYKNQYQPLQGLTAGQWQDIHFQQPREE